MASSCRRDQPRLVYPQVTTVVGTAAPTSAGLTGIAVRPADIPEGVWPEHRQLGAAEQLEVAWGDREFYMAPRAR
jgi:hypothetical protein